MADILVPVDGSTHAEDAVAYAVDHFPDDHVIALHVVEVPTGYFAASVSDPESLPQVENQKREARELLDDIEDTAADLGGSVCTELVTGDPVDEILAYAQENDIDEIVIGSRGISGVGRVMFGSVAEKVVRRSEIPVVVVH